MLGVVSLVTSVKEVVVPFLAEKKLEGRSEIGGIDRKYDDEDDHSGRRCIRAPAKIAFASENSFCRHHKVKLEDLPQC